MAAVRKSILIYFGSEEERKVVLFASKVRFELMASDLNRAAEIMACPRPPNEDALGPVNSIYKKTFLL